MNFTIAVERHFLRSPHIFFAILYAAVCVMIVNFKYKYISANPIIVYLKDWSYESVLPQRCLSRLVLPSTLWFTYSSSIFWRFLVSS